MAKEDEPYRISATQLFEDNKNREIVTLCLSADIALGGGIPRGCTVLIAGKPKSGKTTLCLQFAANAQKKYKCKVFIFPIEGRMSSLVLNQIQGLDKDNVEIVNPPAIFDKDGKVLGFKKLPSEKWFELIGNCIQEHPGCVIIVDSLANMSSEKEQSEDMGFQDRGGRNKLEAEFCRKYGNLIIPNRCIVFLITQIQANTSGFGAPMIAKVGNQMKHQADVMLICKNTEKWPEQNGRILGHDAVYIVEASALGPPLLEMKAPLRYGYGIDNVQDTMNHAITWQQILKAGAWYRIPFDKDGIQTTIEENMVKLQGEANVRDWLFNHPEQTNILEKTIREKILG